MMVMAAVLVAAFFVSACGTTKEERCATAEEGLRVLDEIRAERELTESESRRRLAYEGAFNVFCVAGVDLIPAGDHDT